MNSLNIRQTKLSGVLVVEPPTIFRDFRGVYVEPYNEELYNAVGITVKFVTDDFSISPKNVLRGIHMDPKSWKLISCFYGEFLLVVVNCDTRSPEFGKWESFLMPGPNYQQVLVPPRYGVAHLVTSEEAMFYYKQSAYYDRSRQSSFKWDDPRFNISWPIRNPILSERDKTANG